MRKRRSEDELRRHVRREIGRAGRIVPPEGRSLDCEVHDISETGAMLFLKTDAELPFEFVLEIGGGSEPVRRRCHRVRQEGSTAGVRFPDRPLKQT